jgi:hypothetical protein
MCYYSETLGTRGEGEKCARSWWESPKERNHSEESGVDGRMVTERILGRLAAVCGMDAVGSA